MRTRVLLIIIPTAVTTQIVTGAARLSRSDPSDACGSTYALCKPPSAGASCPTVWMVNADKQSYCCKSSLRCREGAQGRATLGLQRASPEVGIGALPVFVIHAHSGALPPTAVVDRSGSVRSFCFGFDQLRHR
jgi:hypothetical protein